MHCPRCGHSRVYRSKYEGYKEWLRITPFRPYGCRDCHHQFVTWRHKGAILASLQRQVLRLFLVFAASCPMCRSRELVRIKAQSVQGTPGRTVARRLGFPAYRCEKCGKKFFKFSWHVRYSPAPEAGKAGG